MISMGYLTTSTKDESLKLYEKDWVGKGLSNPSLTFYTSMVYGFAKHLPYSMDIEQPEYVPADFYNMEPSDVETNSYFKWNDRRTFFKSMVNWGDTFKTGMLLQMCAIFQKMLLGQFPHNFELKEADFKDWGIDVMTNNKDYNRNFFETLKSLPKYYQLVVNASTCEERRNRLDEMYKEIIQRIAGRYGGLRETDANGNIIRNIPGTIPIRPAEDVKMMVYWENVTYYDGIKPIIKAIKNEQLKKYKQNQPIEIETSKTLIKR